MKRKSIPATSNASRKYYRVGRFDAHGPAAIIKLEDSSISGVPWGHLRVFFRPNDQYMPPLRVRPSRTNVYSNSETNVFAVPPAPKQWWDHIERKRRNARILGDIQVPVELFIENLEAKQYHPHGFVVYSFGETQSAPPLNREKGEQETSPLVQAGPQVGIAQTPVLAPAPLPLSKGGEEAECSSSPASNLSPGPGLSYQDVVCVLVFLSVFSVCGHLSEMNNGCSL